MKQRESTTTLLGYVSNKGRTKRFLFSEHYSFSTQVSYSFCSENFPPFSREIIPKFLYSGPVRCH